MYAYLLCCMVVGGVSVCIWLRGTHGIGRAGTSLHVEERRVCNM